MAYWALQANPLRYRILQAVLDLDEFTWTANRYADQIQQGDIALIWLSGPRAGGYALAEVTAAATPMVEDPAHVPYWVSAEETQAEVPRIRLRITQGMLLYPILRTTCQADPVLSQMLIVRQPAGTVFRVTDEQWARIAAHASGDKIWAREEQILTLASYLDVRDGKIERKTAMARMARITGRPVAIYDMVLKGFAQLNPAAREKRMEGASHTGQQVWSEFAGRPDEVRHQSATILAKLLEGGGLDRLREDARPNKLILVKSLKEIRESVVAFDEQAAQAAERAKKLLRTTTYWVFDPMTGAFGPGKFVGFAGIDFPTYEAATQGQVDGARFDGNTTRTAIEKASGMEFSSDPHMPEMLRKWGDALLGAGTFDGLPEGADNWRFLALPGSACRYWKIAPGEKAVFWDENRDSGLIAVGWGQAGDPRLYPAKEKLEARYKKIFGYNKNQAQRNVRAVMSFIREIQPGDIIVANHGMSKVVGRGVVLGRAEFLAARGEYANCLPVHWFDKQGRDIPQQKSWFTTILPLSAEVYEALFGADVIDNGEPETGVEEDEPSIESEPKPGIYDFLRERGLHFPAELVTTYLLSLKTKPFAILSGISGTGKTKLAQAVAEWAGAGAREVEEAAERSDVHVERGHRHEFVSVRPDWLDGKEVLGFYNVLTENYALRPFSNLLLRAHRDPGRPYFAILDEMNLARVEHYFGDMLSATESRTFHGGTLRQEPLHMHDQRRCLPLAPPEGWTLPERCGACRATEAEIDACPLHFDGVQLVPPRLKVPSNVYITGTVNIDETTHMFSPKVLDRANVIEFNEVDLLGYGNGGELGAYVLEDGRIDLGASTVARQEHFLGSAENVRRTLTALNQILADYHLHFGYRVANEIALYVQNAVETVGPDSIATALDLQVLQKVLPKFHGSKQKLLGPLRRVLLFTIFGRDLGADHAEEAFARIEAAIRKGEPVTPPDGGAAVTPSMPRSAAKLVRMLRTLRAQGFVSFIE